MKKVIALAIILITIFYIRGVFPAQDTTATKNATEVQKKSKEKILPQLQLQEYTIVGLARITLPQKTRGQIFKKVSINWVNNQAVLEKPTSKIDFQFSNIKPSLLRLYQFPWLNSRIYYGSFNTLGLELNSQFKVNSFLPYFTAQVAQSDGHTENAQWSVAQLRTGFHQKIGKGHIFHSGIVYEWNKKGIWRDYKQLHRDWEVQTGLWDFFTRIEQRWTERFKTQIQGRYFLDDHENAFIYKDRGFSVSAGGRLDVKNTVVEVKTEFQNSAIKVSNGNLTQGSTILFDQERFKLKLFNGQFTLQQCLGPFKALAGVLYQTGKEELVLEGIQNNPKFIRPVASFSIGSEGLGAIRVAYRPAIELTRFRSLVRTLPFIDVRNLQLINYTSRFESEVKWQIASIFRLNIQGTIVTAENYPSPILPGDLFRIAGQEAVYPGWKYDVLEKVQISELKGNINWQFVPKMQLDLWVNLRRSEIQKAKNLPVKAIGNSLPYFPDFSAEGSLTWELGKVSKIQFFVKYLGKRYDDPLNQIALKSVFLANSRMELALSKYIRIFVEGENLFNADYQEWSGFTEPGIRGYFGLRIVI